MTSTQAAWSLWDRLAQRHDFYDEINASVEVVIDAIMSLEQRSGNIFYPGTTINIRHDRDGYRFRIAINDRYTHVIASGRLWQDNTTHWEGSIRTGWTWVWPSLLYMGFGGWVSLLFLVYSLVHFEWLKLLFGCGFLFMGVFVYFYAPLLGRNRLRKKLIQILDMFKT